jgi:hypothetical protein
MQQGGGEGKSVLERGVLLEEVEALEENVFDREVVGMVGKDQDGAVLGLGCGGGGGRAKRLRAGSISGTLKSTTTHIVRVATVPEEG